MHQDKKVRDGRLTFVLTRGIGRAFVERDVDAEDVERLLEREIAA
jgi:3-dehydroquinate synthetase